MLQRLCVLCRWKEAAEAGKAPPVLLESTSDAALNVVTLDQLKAHALTQAKAEF